MPQEDFEDLNVATLSETKLQRAPGSEATPNKASWLKAATVVALIVTAALVSAHVFRRRI